METLNWVARNCVGLSTYTLNKKNTGNVHVAGQVLDQFMTWEIVWFVTKWEATVHILKNKQRIVSNLNTSINRQVTICYSS